MEVLAGYIAVYLVGWCMGFLTLASLAFYEGSKKRIPVKVERTNVKDLYPPKDNN